MGYYRIAQICLNGHTITNSADEYPEHKENYCSECGSKTIMSCPNCGKPIKGDYHVPGIFCAYNTYTRPLYCHNCGQPYPWTKEILNVTKELISLDDNLTNDEKLILENDVENIVKNSPRTQLSANRFNSFMRKVSSHTASAMRDILVDIVSETAKKIIWPD